MCKILAAIFFIVCAADSATAQSNSFTPFTDDSLALDKLLKATTLHFESDKAATTGENKKYIIEKYQERYDQLKKMYTDKEFVTNPQAVAYLNALQTVAMRQPLLVKHEDARHVQSIGAVLVVVVDRHEYGAHGVISWVWQQRSSAVTWQPLGDHSPAQC